MKGKELLKSWKFWLLIVFLIIAILSINYQFGAEGAVINSIEPNSSAAIAGVPTPSANTQPTGKEVITHVNSQEVLNAAGYYSIINTLQDDQTFTITTNSDEYTLLKEENKPIGIAVDDAPGSNIRKGLDLQGGTRVVLKPDEQITNDQLTDIMATMANRLNIYGLSDVGIRSASDLDGNKYIVVEIAGATKEDVKEIVAKQGKFEAKIGEDVAFRGGKEDITFVCRTDGTCSRISRCSEVSPGWNCQFEFEISLSPEAAKNQASITATLGINTSTAGHPILDKKLDFYLDDTLVDSLNIAADLKGKEAVNILITGPGTGETRDLAIEDAIKARDKLQTVLITGSLPTGITIVKLDSISPSLGHQFLSNAWLVGLIAVLSVIVVIFIRYRSWKISLAIAITMLAEIVIILGLAALFKYNLDLAAIAAIIATVGTGVDHQIVITDEILNKESSYGTVKDKIKKAFFIIFIASAATVLAMIPLLWAGIGMLKGFAIITIIGVLVGVFITRPAFGVMLKAMLKE